MPIRLIVNITAEPGKGDELAAAYRARCQDVVQEPGCLQFEIFQSAVDPDRLVLLELWQDQATLDVHFGVNATRAPLPPGLRAPGSTRENYEQRLHG